MKYISVILAFLLPLVAAAQQLDSSRAAALGGKLAEYYQTLKSESLPVQEQECDFLIETATDSLVRQFVALDIFKHYRNSKIMGAENVAVHVYDKWFASGKVKMENEADLMEAKVYADFNRQSLIGKMVPSIRMETIDGDQFELFGPQDSIGGYRILFFYDTDCAVCKVETALLGDMLKMHDYPVEIYAIYVGDNDSSWREYARTRFSEVEAVHLWDPSLESDFQRKYGVTRTPRLFLTSPDGTVIGRGLDVAALEILLDDIFTVRNLEYASPESEALYDGIFSLSGGVPSAGEVKGIADFISDRTLAQGDTLMFRQMAGDYLYYLVSRSGEGFKEGMDYHIEKNIFPHKVWTSDDSLKVVGLAQMMHGLLSKAKPGMNVAPVKVPGELYTWKGERSRKVRLDRLKGSPGIIIFYTEGCEICTEEKQAALALLCKGRDLTLPKTELKELRRMKVFMVNVDRLMTTDPSLTTRLMDAFDLSSLPYIIMTDSAGVILRRYVSLCHTF